MRTYQVTINESDTGRFTVANAVRLVQVNQHRTDKVRMPKDAFGFACETDTQSITVTKKAAKKKR